MATRFYLRNSAQTTGISPTPDAGWEDTSGLVRAIASVNKSSDAITTVNFADADATDKDILFRQYVSLPLTIGQTITGGQALSFVVRGSEVNTANNLFTALGIRVLASDGTTVQKTVLAVTRDNTELVTTLTNRNLTATSAATNYTTVAGDRLVIEIGYGGDPTGAADHDGSLSLGDNAGSDLTANDTGTAANNPWVELADTLTFQQYTASGGATSGGAAATATGKVIPKASLTLTGQTPSVKIVALITPAAATLTTTRSTPVAKTVLRPVSASNSEAAYQNYQTAKAASATSISLDWNYGIPKIGHVYYAIFTIDGASSSPSFTDNAGNTWFAFGRGVGNGQITFYATTITNTLANGSTWTLTYSNSNTRNFMLGLVHLGPAVSFYENADLWLITSTSKTSTLSAKQAYGRVSVISAAYMITAADDAILTYPSDMLYLSNTGATDGAVLEWGVSNSTDTNTLITRSWTFSNPGSVNIGGEIWTVPFSIGIDRQTPSLTTTLYPAAASLTLTGETPVVTTGGGGTTNYEYSASGGITSGGAATTSATSGYAYSALGGATSGGAATTSTSAAYAYTASGGVTSGGAATTTTEAAYTYSATGGATSGGAADTAAEYHYAYDASGGATSGGSASTEYSAAGTTSYTYDASGGITSGGAATTEAQYAYAYTADGGATSGGAADTSATSAYAYSAEGGIASGGAATTARATSYAYAATGGATSGGTATTTRTIAYAYTASGGVTSGGTATTSQADTYVYTASGGATAGGTAAVAYFQVYSYTATGGATSGGAAVVLNTKAFAYAAAGGVTSGGAATTGVLDIPGRVTITLAAGGVVTSLSAGTVSQSTQQVGRVEVSVG